MKIKAKGRIRFRFWGNYSEMVALEFENAEQAGMAKSMLNVKTGTFYGATGMSMKSLGWRQIDKGLVCECGGEHLERVHAILRKYGAPDSMASMAKSIDYGPVFEIEIEYEDKNQMNLL